MTQKWEYLCYKEMKQTDETKMVEDLDKLGQRGWEAFAVQESSISITIWLKRQLLYPYHKLADSEAPQKD